MRIIESFSGWLNSSQLNENISATKSYMFKRYADANQIEPNQLTPEDQANALNDRAYRKILEIVNGMPGYAFAFVRFHFEHGATMAQLTELVNTIKAKKHIIQQLPKQVDQYANQETVNGITGFEALMDDIRTIERAKEAKWLIDRLPKALRDGYRALPREEQQDLINAAHQLKELGEEAIKRLTSKIASMSNWSISDVTSYITNYLAGFSNLQMRSKIDEITALEPEAGIIYMDDQYLVLSARTENSQKKLCSVANWCINRGSFSSYANDAVQLNIFNFGIPPTDPMFLVGTTIRYSGETRTTHDINDAHINKSSDPAENLRLLGYPEKLISTVMKEFPMETAVKKLIYDLKIDTDEPTSLFKHIISTDYRVSLSADPRTLAIVSDIIYNRVAARMSPAQIIAFYSEFGVMSKFSAMLFKDLLKDSSPEEVRPALDRTLANFTTVNNIIKRNPNLSTDAVRNVLAQEKEVYAELGLDQTSVDEMLNEFSMAEPAVKPAPVKTPAPTKPAPSRPSPVPTKQPFKQPEPAKAEAEDVLKRYYNLLDEKS